MADEKLIPPPPEGSFIKGSAADAMDELIKSGADLAEAARSKSGVGKSIRELIRRSTVSSGELPIKNKE